MAKKTIFGIIFLIFCLFSTSKGLIFNVPAHYTECFFEVLDVGVEVRITYFVTQGGNNDIDFEVFFFFFMFFYYFLVFYLFFWFFFILLSGKNEIF